MTEPTLPPTDDDAPPAPAAESRPGRVSRRLLVGLIGGGLAVGVGGYLGANAIYAQVKDSAVLGGPPDPGPFFDPTRLHTVSVTMDEKRFRTVVASYLDGGGKEWVQATAVIDGTTYQRVGMRLKGNSSLKGVGLDSDPATLPWLVRLDEYVEHASRGGMTEFVIRSNSSASALNEAVALDLLREAGLPAENSAYVRFQVNGGTEQLRLVTETPDQQWADRELGTDGILYKADAEGDYSYRGDDPASYANVFDQETGTPEDLSPLIGFLQFINESTDADFIDELPARLDVEAFATYLAFEALIDNFDDISGPGNNSYLWWDRPDGQMTVVAWDHNLAFGLTPGAAGQGGAPGAAPPGGYGTPPAGAPDAGGVPPADAGAPGRGGPAGKENALVTRFTADANHQAAIDDASADLRARLLTSGYAERRLKAWAAVVGTAPDLVPEATLAQEEDSIRTYVV